MTIQNHLFEKYLRLLNVEHPDTTYEFLCKIVKAHLIRIPFENISKLLFRKEGMNYIPTLELFLEGIEKYNFGGTCYSNNYYLYLLLKHLGFDVILCGADMKNPDVHVISVVKIEGRKFIIDVGYAAPFFLPLPIDTNLKYQINFANEKYIIKPKNEFSSTVIEQYSNGKLKHWYTTNLLERKIEDFKKVIEESYSDDAVFMNAIRITKFSETGSIVLKNLMLTETENNNTLITKIFLGDIPSLIQKKFGMFYDIVQKAINHFTELRDIYN